jgi:hypothetical protein
VDIVLLWTGWAIAWTSGVAVLLALHTRTATLLDDGEIAFVTGAGFFVGQFLLTLWMRVLAAIGVPFGRVAIGGALVAIGALALWLAWRRHGTTLVAAIRLALHGFASRDLPKEQRALRYAILAWLAVRFALLLIEVLRRPLYPWDAWTQWATKARVWYEERTMVPFVDASRWLSDPTSSVWFDAAPHYPGTVPLTQVWSATLLGRFDDALINLPWWITAVAFGFAVYGFLRRRGLGPLGSLVATWLVLSLPILDAHVALAGYADLAMATYLTLTAFAALRFVQSRAAFDLVLALVLAAACVVIKQPGKAWILMLLPGLVAALVPRYGLRIAGAAFALAAIAALVLTRTGVSLLGYHLQLQFDMPWSGLTEAYFLFANWHLLFYGAIVVALLAWRRLLSPALAPLTLIVGAGVAFLMFGFAFTNARLWVEDQSTVNRATLHLAPLIVVWMVLAFRAWAASRSPPAATEHAAAATAA